MAADLLKTLGKTASHEDFIDATKKLIKLLIEKEGCLKDLKADCSNDEVCSLIALHHGQAMKIKLLQGDGGTISVIVPQDSTVRDFKKAVARHFLLEMGKRRSTKISLRYVWKTYDVTYHGDYLEDDQKLISYGIKNKSTLEFRPKSYRRKLL